MNLSVLVTGANGFVGRHLCAALAKRVIDFKPVLRKASAEFSSHRPVVIAEINAHTDWSNALVGVDCVVHLAARVHVMQDAHANPLEEYRRVNVDSTLNLARQAASAGVKRFVFMSSAKVNGEFNQAGRPFTADDLPGPSDPYGVSKLEAECALMQLSQETGMEVVVIRPPLVYGNGVKANFANMLKLIKLGFPLPFGAIHNQRSLIYIENLTSFITACITHPKAANNTFLVSDGEDVSTTQLLKACACALNKPLWLIPVPQAWLAFVFKLLGKASMADRLLGNLQIDNTHACQTLAWRPPYTLAQGLGRTVNVVLDTDEINN